MDISIWQVIAVLWLSLGLTRVRVMYRPLKAQQRAVMQLFRDIGLSDDQIEEAGFKLQLRAILWGTPLFALIATPWMLVRANVRYFNPVDEITSVKATIMLFKSLIEKDGRYVELMRRFEASIPDETVH